MSYKSCQPFAITDFHNLAVCILFFAVSFSLSAQQQSGYDGPSFNNTTAPSSVNTANAANVTDNLSSGTSKVSIPIFNLKGKTLSLPITLSTSTAGLKVYKESGSVGMNWVLNSGGSIVRQVMDVPDDVYYSQYSGQPYNLPGRVGWYYDDASDSPNFFLPDFPCISSIGLHVGQINNCPEDYPLAEAFRYNVEGHAQAQQLRMLKAQGSSPEYYDTEPDIFTLSAAGLSSTFLIGHDGEVKMVKASNPGIEISIQKHSPFTNDRWETGVIESFSVKTPDGKILIFEQKEIAITKTNHTTQSHGIDLPEEEQYQYTSAWHLTTITDAFEFDRIDFEYTTTQLKTISQFNEGRTICREDDTGNCISGGSLAPFWRSIPHKTVVTNEQVLPSTISTAYEIANFTYEDLPDLFGGKRLSSINFRAKLENAALRRVELKYEEFAAIDMADLDAEITQLNNYLQQYSISYRYAQNDLSLKNRIEAAASIRSFLYEVQISNGSESLPPYRFEYFSPDLLPNKRSKQQDHWGYYNNNESTSLIPELYVYPNAIEGYNRYRIAPMRSGHPEGNPVYYLQGANRSVNISTIKYGALKRVVYPSGSTASFNYEPNEYYDNDADTNLLGGGIRLKSKKNLKWPSSSTRSSISVQN